MDNKKGNMEAAIKAAARTLKEFGTMPSVRFRITDDKPSIFESKIGGIPYMPKNVEIPVYNTSEQLRFLMQIKCSDVKGCDIFPKSGILQFWIAGDDVWGLYEDGGFRVIYYDTIDETVSENDISSKISEMNDMEKEYFPLKGEFGVEFYPCEETIPTDSMKYQKLFIRYYNELSGENIKSIYDLPWEILNIVLYQANSAYGHKIGGSSDFCQFDPRESEEDFERYDFQLLQMSSDFSNEHENIMWGDGGVAHFFIKSEKLKNCDFSDILYYADCC